MYICRIIELSYEKENPTINEKKSFDSDLNVLLPLLGFDSQQFHETQQLNVKENCIYGIKSKNNEKFISSENNGDFSLAANRNFISSNWEKFYFMKNFDGSYSIKSLGSSKFVSTKNKEGNTFVKANKCIRRIEEKFYLIKNSDGSVSFKCTESGKYVGVDDSHYSILNANREFIDYSCKFDLKKYCLKRVFCNFIIKIFK
jgi:hypothetical protein